MTSSPASSGALTPPSVTSIGSSHNVVVQSTESLDASSSEVRAVKAAFANVSRHDQDSTQGSPSHSRNVSAGRARSVSSPVGYVPISRPSHTLRHPPLTSKTRRQRPDISNRHSHVSAKQLAEITSWQYSYLEARGLLSPHVRSVVRQVIKERLRKRLRARGESDNVAVRVPVKVGRRKGEQPKDIVQRKASLSLQTRLDEHQGGHSPRLVTQGTPTIHLTAASPMATPAVAPIVPYMPFPTFGAFTAGPSMQAVAAAGPALAPMQPLLKYPGTKISPRVSPTSMAHGYMGVMPVQMPVMVTQGPSAFHGYVGAVSPFGSEVESRRDDRRDGVRDDWREVRRESRRDGAQVPRNPADDVRIRSDMMDGIRMLKSPVMMTRSRIGTL